MRCSSNVSLLADGGKSSWAVAGNEIVDTVAAILSLSAGGAQAACNQESIK